jgi:hypothetical protein
MGHRYAHRNQKPREPSKIPFESAIVAIPPHAVRDLVVVGRVDKVTNQSRQAPVMETPRHSFNVAGEEVLKQLRW